MNYALVILAGGQSTRMGSLSRIITKSAVPIFNTTLIKRQIEQAVNAGIENIIISTNKTLYTQIKILVSDFNNVKVISNPLHKKGSMNALLKIMEMNKKIDRVIMSLADIYFIENPFYKIIKLLNSKKTILFAAKPFDNLELSRGGVIFPIKGYVMDIIEKPIPLNIKGYRWTGLAIFNSCIRTELRSFLKLHPGLAEEDFFQALKNKEEIKINLTSDFINVNTPSQMFLASIYQVIEATSGKGFEIKLLQQSAEYFRTEILKKNKALSFDFE